MLGDYSWTLVTNAPERRKMHINKQLHFRRVRYEFLKCFITYFNQKKFNFIHQKLEAFANILNSFSYSVLGTINFVLMTKQVSFHHFA
jgi:hypothetical protein